MKAIVLTKYGPPEVLQFTEADKPVPQDDEVLVKVHATSANAGDWHLMRADPWLIRLMFGLRKPKVRILGADAAGRVEVVGKNVTQFQPGDEVFADVSSHGFGGFAEYVCAPENAWVIKPANVTFEQAAAVPSAAVTALQGLRDKGRIQAGQQVLINGASGGVGSFAVQIAKAFGAEVTAVCSTNKMDMVRALGADHVIDYTREDCTKNGKLYDLILDAAAFRSVAAYRRVLTLQGTYVLVGGSLGRLFQVMWLSLWASRKGMKFTNYLVNPNKDDLSFVKQLLEAGKVTPAIDRCYPLSETADAIRHIESRAVKGKVVIAVAR
jgi:NADPH:quinone reductase-like Zn-dependent oxidoreductase